MENPSVQRRREAIDGKPISLSLSTNRRCPIFLSSGEISSTPPATTNLLDGKTITAGAPLAFIMPGEKPSSRDLLSSAKTAQILDSMVAIFFASTAIASEVSRLVFSDRW
ncbi:hypothetical protein ACLOJK_016618 [Asimina triloba]